MSDDSFKKMLDEEIIKQKILDELEEGLRSGDQKKIDNANSRISNLSSEEQLKIQKKAREINKKIIEKTKGTKDFDAFNKAETERVMKTVPSADTLKKPPMSIPNEPNIHVKGSSGANALEKLLESKKFAKIASALGKRVAKATPYIGTGLGLLSAKDALAKGDKVGAALETVSAFDPTPISDIALGAKDVYDILTEPSEEKKQIPQKSADPEAVKNMVKVLGGEPDISPKKASTMVGEKPSEDVSGQNYSTYENYIKEQKRKLGYK